jgi:uncharacterized protein
MATGQRSICYEETRQTEERLLFQEALKGTGPLLATTVLRGLLTGSLAGFAAGLLGVSPGGILVPIISLTLGFPQHLAQAVSLVCQAPPSSLSGFSSYFRRGRNVPLAFVFIVSVGFVVGGPIGAALTTQFSDRQLRSMFVGYLVLLAILAILKASRPEKDVEGERKDGTAGWAPLLLIGLVAGMSSGLLGIGGGLAITALSTLFLHMGQHRAQALSLVVTALPLTLPAAWMYAHQGVPLPWPAILAIVVGLFLGTAMGASLANRLPERILRIVFIALILGMALYMGLTR